MTTTTQPTDTALSELPRVEATINYAGATEGSPYFSVEDRSSNAAFDSHKIFIHDARPIQNQFSLDREGFALVRHVSTVAGMPEIRAVNVKHEMGRNSINDAYHREVSGFLRALTGARA